MTKLKNLLNEQKIVLLLISFLFLFYSCQNNDKNTEPYILQHWVAGEKYPLPLPGNNHELLSLFAQQEITDPLFARIKGLSFKDDCTTPRSDLRYLKVLHYNLNGDVYLGEIICHKAISDDLIAIFKELFKARYPIERMVLIDAYKADDETSMTANNSSAFNFRFISGTTRLSNHSRGLAVDINPLYNPYVVNRNGQTFIEPAAGLPYVDRTKSFAYKIDASDLCCKLFIEHGFTWGGNWIDRKDYQHFEKKID